MSLVLKLPADLEDALAAEAGRLHLPLDEYAVRLLTLSRTVDPKLFTTKEVIAYWEGQGLIGTRPDIADASEHARLLRVQAERH